MSYLNLYYKCRKCAALLTDENIETYRNMVMVEHKESQWSSEKLGLRSMWVRTLVKFRDNHICDSKILREQAKKSVN